MNTRRILFSSVLLAIPTLGLAAVSCSESTGTEDGGGGTSGDEPPIGGLGGDPLRGETVTPDECEPDGEDLPDPDFIDQNCDGIDGDASKAIFVSPLGDDSAAGTLDAPVETLAKAVELAAAAEGDVYACAAVFEENLELTGAVRIFGGFACEDGWSRTEVPVEVAPKSGLPLSISTKGDVQIENMMLHAADAGSPGASSVAAKVVDSTNVIFRRVELVAGKGANAEATEEARVHEDSAGIGKEGDSAPSYASTYGDSCFSGGAFPEWDSACEARALQVPQAWSCPGNPGLCPHSCETDEEATLSVFRSEGGDGGNGIRTPDVAAGSGSPLPNKDGAGTDGAHGAAAEEGFGSIADDGSYLPTNAGSIGKFGGVGESGSGGDGGPAVFYQGQIPMPQIGGAGGSSGFPGCGGYPGNGGLAGGGSIGLIIVNSIVSLERVDVATSEGGAGASPTAGSPGQKGGDGGLGGRSTTQEGELGGNTAYGGKDGEPGGDGATGGSGGPGGGGPSVGIVVVGDEPTLKALTFDIAAGGEGASPLEETVVSSGADGISEDVHVVTSDE